MSKTQDCLRHTPRGIWELIKLGPKETWNSEVHNTTLIINDKDQQPNAAICWPCAELPQKAKTANSVGNFLIRLIRVGSRINVATIQDK